MINWSKYQRVMESPLWTYTGQVTKVVGLGIESLGPIANIGDICSIQTQTPDKDLLAEVVGFKDKHLFLMPLGDLDGIRPGCLVTAHSDKIQIRVDKQLLGHVVDWKAQPIDKQIFTPAEAIPIENTPPHPLLRNRIANQMVLGIRSIDGMLSIGKGQRIGIFAGSGVGKSTLLGMIARNALSDINVIALIGERAIQL
jgi:flagellum-specific ATP synthase